MKCIVSLQLLHSSSQSARMLKNMTQQSLYAMSRHSLCDVESLASELHAPKHCIIGFVKKHGFKENKDWICSNMASKHARGGHNRKVYTLRQDVMDLVRSTYNLKHRYVPLCNNLRQVNTIMNVENATVGFIAACLDGVVAVQRQLAVGPYHVDMFIPAAKTVVECDEQDHKYYDYDDEMARQSYIKNKLHCKFLRFNPSDEAFDFAKIINQILLDIKTSLSIQE